MFFYFMPKDYYEKWEYRLWLANKRVGDLDPCSRGIWVDWLSNMMEDEAYGLTGNLDDFAKWGRCTKVQALATLKDLAEHGTADFEIEGVTQNVTHFVRNLSAKSFPIVTVVSRKRKRDLKRKLDNRLRKRKQRASQERPDESHTPNSKSKSNSGTYVPETPRLPSRSHPDFQRLMDHHGKRIGHVGDAGAQGKAINALKKFTAEDLIAYYDYQVKQLITNGGWRDSVSWLTVAKTIGEWVIAGRPSEPLEKNRTQKPAHIAAAQVGKWDGSESYTPPPVCARCGSDVCLGGKKCDEAAAKLQERIAA